MPVALTPVCVWYVELRNAAQDMPDGEAAAVATLRRWLADLPTQPGYTQAGCLGAELLVSPAQPGLALVTSRWQSDPPEWPLPQAARGWRFRVVDTAPAR